MLTTPLVLPVPTTLDGIRRFQNEGGDGALIVDPTVLGVHYDPGSGALPSGHPYCLPGWSNLGGSGIGVDSGGLLFYTCNDGSSHGMRVGPVIIDRRIDSAGVPVLVFWLGSPSVQTPSGNVYVQIDYARFRNGSVIQTGQGFVLCAMTVSWQTSQYRRFELNLSAGLLQPGDVISAAIQRLGAHASDTNSGAWRMMAAAFLETRVLEV